MGILYDIGHWTFNNALARKRTLAHLLDQFHMKHDFSTATNTA